MDIRARELASPDHAIEASSVARHYGKGKGRVNVLNNINMVLPRGFARLGFISK